MKPNKGRFLPGETPVVRNVDIGGGGTAAYSAYSQASPEAIVETPGRSGPSRGRCRPVDVPGRDS